MAVELGTAFLTVMPSMRGMSGKLAAEMQKEGAAAQKSFSEGMSRGNVVTAGAKKVTSAVGGLLKTGLAATGLSAGAVLGKALFGGFNRLKDVENAQAKLAGLGHSAKSVQAIMDDALASVKGTAFGLDEAASVAASTVAAGVKPGKDLERTLKLVADAATIGGASMGEMGSIFNKVAASNKVQGEVIAQLNDRGIPIIQLLSKELGKSAEETVKLASEGKINFDTFRNAMESGLGGAALKSGETMQGSFKNMGAALSRLGQNLLKGVFPQLAGGFTGITQALDNLGPAAEKVGAFLGDVLAKAAAFITEKVVPAARAGIEAVQLFIGSFTGEGADIGEFLPPDLWDPIINAGAKARQIFDEVAPKIKTAFDTAKQTIADLAPKVLDLVGKLGELANWAKENADWLISLAGGIAAAVAAYKAFKAITAAVTAVQLALNVALSANPIGIVVAAIAGFVAALVLLYNKNEAFRNLVNTVWAAIKTAIGAVINWFKKWVVPVATRVFQDIGKVANWLWTNVIRPVAGFIQTAFKAVGNVLKAVWTGFLQPIFKLIGQVFRALFQVHIKVISTAIQVAFKAIGSAMKWVWETLLRPVFNLIRTVFAAVARDLSEKFSKIKAGWRVLSDAMRSVWNKYIRPVFDAVGKVVGGLHEKFKKGVDAIGKAWDLLKDKAKEPVRFVVETVINGLIGKFNDIAGFFGADKIDKLSLPPGFHGGGWTGPGDKFKPAGIVHADEFVVSKAARQRFERKFPGYLDHINRTGSLPGYAKGGMVDGPVGGSASDVVTWKGKRFSRLFARNLQLAEQMSGTSFSIFQGGFRPATSYSGTSHAKDAIDLGPITNAVIVALRRVGIAAWDRTGKGNWAPHIHAVPTPGAGYAGGSAVWQAQDYLRGGDGLGGRDNGPRVNGSGGVNLPKGLDLGIFTNPAGAVQDFFSGITAKLSEITGSPFGKAVASVPGKVVDMAVDKIKSLVNPFGYAGGTRSASRGLHWVGERGPELVDFKGGEAVYTTSESARMTRGSGGPMEIRGTLDLGNGLRGYVEGVVSESVRAAGKRV